MKKPVYLALALCLCVGSLQAQNGHRPTFYLNTGMTIPSSPFAFDYLWSTGPNFGAGIGYLVAPIVTVQGYLDYSHLPMNDLAFMGAYGLPGDVKSMSGGATSIFTLSANIKLDMRPMDMPAWPYFIVGVSYFRVSIHDVKYNLQSVSQKWIGSHENAFGLSLGTGVEIKIQRRLTVFAEGKLGIGYTEGSRTQYFPLKAGISFR